MTQPSRAFAAGAECARRAATRVASPAALTAFPVAVHRRLNSRLLRLGASPVAVTRMRLGHRLRLDLRSGSQGLAYYSGEFDDARIAAATRLLDDRGGMVVDVGANVGLWAVPLGVRAAAVGGRLLAIEPVPSNACWRYRLSWRWPSPTERAWRR